MIENKKDDQKKVKVQAENDDDDEPMTIQSLQ